MFRKGQLLSASTDGLPPAVCRHARIKPGKQSVRKQLGQALPLVVACLFVLTIGAFAAMQFGVLTGGSQQVRNAVDAGALNMAAHAPDIQVPPPAAFKDVANTSGQISMTNINRVLSKALLINLNAQSMKTSGQTGQSQGNAQLALNDATNVSQQLTNALSDPQFLGSNFGQVSSGTGSGSGGNSDDQGQQKSKQQPKFASSYVHRGQSSNISANSSQFPPGTSININNGMLPGYTPLNANSSQFYLVSFKQGEKPHLISTDEFNSNAAPPTNWNAPVPNALQGQGQLGPNIGVQSVASAVINPQQSYQLAIPQAFVEIQFQPTPVTWQVNGKQASTSTYQLAAQTQYQIKNYKVGCHSQLNGYASLGNEYAGGTVASAIAGVTGNAAHQAALQDITQRLDEIQPGFTAKQLSQLLSQQALVPNVFTYVLYPVYKTADNTDPQIQISPINNVNAGWFNPGATPDGTAKSLGAESLQDSPNSSWGQVIGNWQLQSHHVNVSGQVMWTPGSGYNQCLGLLQLNRTAKVTFTGKCP